MQITSGKIPGALKIGIYGSEGIGKTTFASRFPEPLFIDTENSTAQMDVKRLPRPLSWTELLNEADWVRTHPESCKTLVVDTIDWAEALCAEHVCAKAQKEGIEDFGYGKGYVYLAEEWGRLLDKLELVRQAGVHIVLTAHAQITKFEQPDEMGAYDRWSMKTTKKVAPMVREWVDALFFANYKTIVVNVDGQGAQKGKNKVQGGQRVMYTTHNPCWDAKNRFGLPDELPFDYAKIAAIIDGQSAAPKPAQAAQEKPQEPPAQRATDSPTPAAAPQRGAQAATEAKPEEPGIPEALKRLMDEAGLAPEEVKHVIAMKGFYPYTTPWKVITANQDFMNGWLMHPNVWPKVAAMALEERGKDPF